jgi:hypothetical protein
LVNGERWRNEGLKKRAQEGDEEMGKRRREEEKGKMGEW